MGLQLLLPSLDSSLRIAPSFTHCLLLFYFVQATPFFLFLSFFLSKHFKDLFLSSTISVVEINLEGRKNKIKLKFQSLHHKEEENGSRISMNDCILGTKS